MSDYVFLTTEQSNLAPSSVSAGVRGNFVDVDATLNITERDVVHMKYKENGIPKGVYGVCVFSDQDSSTPTFSFEFDQNIYPLFSNVAQSNFLGITVYRTVAHDNVSYYSIETSVTRANYSEELKSYKVSLDHSLTINNDGRDFFGDFKDVVVADKILFADLCENYAYGVSLDEDSYNTRYNKFRRSVSFNIAKR